MYHSSLVLFRLDVETIWSFTYKIINATLRGRLVLSAMCYDSDDMIPLSVSSI